MNAPLPLPPPILRGERTSAGLGTSVTLPDFDFETYSEAGYIWREDKQRWGSPDGAPGTTRGLGLVGAPAYSEHPSTEVLSLAYDLKDAAGPRMWLPGMPAPAELFDYLADPRNLIEAWNVGFERLIWGNVCRRRYGWPELRIDQLRCAMAKSRAHGLPGRLGLAGQVLGLAVQKDKEGDRLLKMFSMPRNPTKADPRRRITLADAPADAAGLARYNLTDIAAEAAVARQCPDLEGDELEFWLADQRINARGVAIDIEGVRNCIAIVEQAHDRANAELSALTGGAVQRASEIAKLQAWLRGQGVHLDSLDEESVAAQLELLSEQVMEGSMDPNDEWFQAVYRALELRQQVGSASVKKVYAMNLQVCQDNRLRDLFTYHAARTGRPTGNGPQPTNLPKAGPKVYRCTCGRHSSPPEACTWCGMPRPPGARDVEWCVEAAEDALAAIATRDISTVERHYREPMLAVSGCLRSLFQAGPGKELISSDFTAIEAVVNAALAGEQWRLDVFRAGTDIYLESISRSTGTPLENLVGYKKERGMHHPLRQKGKIQELSLGFGGWLGALRAFGAEGTDDELKAQVLAWRAASPWIVEFWGGQTRDFGRSTDYFGLEGAAVMAVKQPGFWRRVSRLDGSPAGVSYLCTGGVLYCKLPSGRHLAYHNPRLSPADKAWRGEMLTFEGYNTNPKKGPPGWQTMQLYGGLLCENVVQAAARDIQRHAIINLEKRGYPVVLHVYDEDVSEVPEGWGSIEEFESIMSTMPAWAGGWPIGAKGGWRGRRYRKA